MAASGPWMQLLDQGGQQAKGWLRSSATPMVAGWYYCRCSPLAGLTFAGMRVRLTLLNSDLTCLQVSLRCCRRPQ